MDYIQGDIDFKKGDKVYHKRLGVGIFQYNVTIMKAVINFNNSGLQTTQKRMLELYDEKIHNKQKEPKIKELSESKQKQLERNNKIKELLDSGLKYFEIAKELNLRRGTVDFIAKSKFGINYMKDNKNHYLNLIEKVKIDLNEKELSYSSIITKHKLTPKDLAKFTTFNFKLKHEFNKLRNDKMGDKYENGTIARKLTSKKESYIKTIGGVYGVVSGTLGIYKYPKIKRGLKGLFEDRRVIRIIKDCKKRTKFTLTNNEIADLLNKKGYKTTTGKEFLWTHVSNIWTKVKKGEHKIQKIDLKSYRTNKYK